MKSILVGLVMCQALIAASPVLTELQPRGAQKGKTLTLTLAGRCSSHVIMQGSGSTMRTAATGSSASVIRTSTVRFISRRLSVADW